jgi:hypothetical protein
MKRLNQKRVSERHSNPQSLSKHFENQKRLETTMSAPLASSGQRTISSFFAKGSGAAVAATKTTTAMKRPASAVVAAATDSGKRRAVS